MSATRETFGAREKGGWDDGVEVTITIDDVILDLQLCGDTNGVTGSSSSISKSAAIKMAKWILENLGSEATP